MKKIICLVLITLFSLSFIFPTVAYINNCDINTKFSRSININFLDRWIQIQKLLASDGAKNDFFGFSVSLCGDTALIGAYGDDYSGCAYVFTRNGTTWTQQAKLTALDATNTSGFGKSVSLDGDTALIGAYEYSENGSAYVFTRNGTTWTQLAKLTAPDAQSWDYFGWSVSLSGDTALIASPYDDDRYRNTGSAYVFTRNGTIWEQQAKLTAPDGESWDCFSISVSLSGDTALIASPYDDDRYSQTGSAYVFTRNGTTWTQQAKLTASDTEIYDRFGSSVSLEGDTALIGKRGTEGGYCGSAYVFTRNGTTWTQQAKLTASDAEKWDYFGSSVSLEGDTALIGAHAYARNGSAYVFTRNGTTWTQQQKITALDGASKDYFGGSVSLDGDTALIGAYYKDDSGFDSGAVYVFIKDKSPEKPTITGKIIGKIGKKYEYKFVSIDPNEDEISYYIDWGDNTSSGWTRTLPSGEYYNTSHNWTEKGRYTIKAKARDIYGVESDWSTFPVSMLKTNIYNSIIELLMKIVKCFSFFDKILNQI